MNASLRPPGSAPGRSTIARLRAAAIMAGLAAAVVVLVVLQVRALRGSAPGPVRPWPVMPPASARIDIGVTTLPLARNSWRRWQSPDLETVNVWEHLIRKHASVVMWYADWTTSAPSLLQLEAVADRGSVPEITWEPWRSTTAVTVQPRFRLRNIIAGRFDRYIRSWALRLAAYARPVRLRFAQEMNGDWYPWSELANGNRLGEFVLAWRHVHRIFRAAGATNVQWVWGPAAINMTRAQYPGDAYVDMVSLTTFNGGLQLRHTRWRPLAAQIAHPLKQLHDIAPRKPIELSEVGSAERGGNKAAWIAGMFAILRRHPEITSVIWYDMVKGSDWRLASSEEAAAAFAAGVADPRYR